MRMMKCLAAALTIPLIASTAMAGTITVNYTVDAGGSNPNPLNGLAALATFETSGNQLDITLENTSTGLPIGFDSAASLLVSVGFNLPGGLSILSGDSAVIAPGSIGISQWSSRSAGNSVAEDWAWTNIGGGDLLGTYAQVISTSSGNQGLTRFDLGSGSIDGPWGGLTANPLLASIPGSRHAVSNSIVFSVKLSSALSDAELSHVANGSIVEFGSDVRYLSVPEPSTLALLGLAVLPLLRARRRAR